MRLHTLRNARRRNPNGIEKSEPEGPNILRRQSSSASYKKLTKTGKIVAKSCLIAVFMLLSALPADSGAAEADKNYAVTVYGGRMTDGDFGDTFTGQADFVDAYVLVGAFAWTFARFYDNALSFEIEGQVGKWFGDQHNWEFNFPAAVRWSKFPWDKYVATSLAYGVGPSYALTEPEEEIELNNSTKKFMVYWFGELTLGPPDSNWAACLRIHHRSGAFGLVEEQGRGGSNTLAAGLKYRF
jgi:hypothetical protein